MTKHLVTKILDKPKALLLIECFEAMGIAYDEVTHTVADKDGLQEYYKHIAYVKDATQAYELGKMHALKMVRAELKILNE